MAGPPDWPLACLGDWLKRGGAVKTVANPWRTHRSVGRDLNQFLGDGELDALVLEFQTLNRDSPGGS